MLYRFIDTDNLKEIQQEILKKIPATSFDRNDLFYVKDSTNYFLDIPVLKDLLTKLGFIDHIHENGIAINVTFPKVTLPIHYDSDKFVYSFNIPILNYAGSYVNFWSTEAQPKDFPRIHPVYKTTVISKAYDPAECKLLDSIEVLSPCVINTRVPHNVRNISNDIRVMLLIRLASTVDYMFD